MARPFILLGGLLLFVLTAYFNLGIIAIDDYAFVISQTIPAQSNSSAAILKNTGLWHPVLPFLLHSISTVALQFGITDPYQQLQIVLVILALFTFSVQAFLLPRFFQTDLEKNISIGFLSFYFISPLLFTRPMIEAAAAPLLLLSAYCAHRYFQLNSRKSLFFSVIILSIASLFRYQVGVCAFALVFLVGCKRSILDFAFLAFSFVIGFFLSGGIDFILTGQFHGSIQGYLGYNLAHSTANHGQQPFYTFLLLFIALTFPPMLVTRYTGFDWKGTYRRLLAPLSFFFFFVIAHTMTPHKEERFMIPVLPLFFVCLTPLVAFILVNRPAKWRIAIFVPLNLVLLFLTCFSTPQSNILGLVRFLDHSPHVQRIYSWEDTLVVFPTAFSTRIIDHVEIKSSNPDSITHLSCNEVVAFREAYRNELPVSFSNLIHMGSFEPGPLESLLVKLNPIRNARRGTIELFGKKGCE